MKNVLLLNDPNLDKWLDWSNKNSIPEKGICDNWEKR